jgi:energy-coupling factor transporter ATP-binding protein EcfA2
MKPLILVIGSANSGKSTVISSLTGCSHRTFRGEIEDKVSGKIIYVICSSPQEDPLRLGDFPRILNKVLDKLEIIGLVVAVQPTHPRTRLSLEDMVQKAQETKRFKIYSFLLDPPYNGDGSYVNQTRIRLNAMGIVPISLNGKRFALFSANDIHRITGIP